MWFWIIDQQFNWFCFRTQILHWSSSVFINGEVHPKMKILSSFRPTHPNGFFFFCVTQSNIFCRMFSNCFCPYNESQWGPKQHLIGSHWLPLKNKIKPNHICSTEEVIQVWNDMRVNFPFKNQTIIVLWTELQWITTTFFPPLIFISCVLLFKWSIHSKNALFVLSLLTQEKSSHK